MTRDTKQSEDICLFRDSAPLLFPVPHGHPRERRSLLPSSKDSCVQRLCESERAILLAGATDHNGGRLPDETVQEHNLHPYSVEIIPYLHILREIENKSVFW